jgi:outer membrane protein
MEVDLAQSRNALLEAEGTLSRAADAFKLAVGLDLVEEVTVRTDFALNVFDVNDTLAIRHGLKNRAEIREGEINRRLAEISLREIDARSTVKGEVRAFYDLTGVSDPFLPYSSSATRLLRSSFDDLRSRPHNRGILLNVSVPLWDSGVNHAEVEAAKASLDQRQLDLQENRRRVTRQIRSAITRLRESRSRLEALKKSEDVAHRSYDISLARFDNGDITTQELALDRDRLTQARLTYLDAYIQYQLAVADLKRQTLYDFENDRSLVEETN